MGLTFNGTERGSDIKINGNEVQNLKMGTSDVWSGEFKFEKLPPKIKKGSSGDENILIGLFDIYDDSKKCLHFFGTDTWYGSFIHLLYRNGEYTYEQTCKNLNVEYSRDSNGGSYARVVLHNNKLYAFILSKTNPQAYYATYVKVYEYSYTDGWQYCSVSTDFLGTSGSGYSTNTAYVSTPNRLSCLVSILESGVPGYSSITSLYCLADFSFNGATKTIVPERRVLEDARNSTTYNAYTHPFKAYNPYNKKLNRIIFINLYNSERIDFWKIKVPSSLGTETKSNIYVSNAYSLSSNTSGGFSFYIETKDKSAGYTVIVTTKDSNYRVTRLTDDGNSVTSVTSGANSTIANVIKYGMDSFIIKTNGVETPYIRAYYSTYASYLVYLEWDGVDISTMKVKSKSYQFAPTITI